MTKTPATPAGVTTTWPIAILKALAIVVYFIFATVWLPDMIITTKAIAEASTIVRETVVVATWGIGLFVGLVGLHHTHKRGII